MRETWRASKGSSTVAPAAERVGRLGANQRDLGQVALHMESFVFLRCLEMLRHLDEDRIGEVVRVFGPDGAGSAVSVAVGRQALVTPSHRPTTTKSRLWRSGAPISARRWSGGRWPPVPHWERS